MIQYRNRYHYALLLFVTSMRKIGLAIAGMVGAKRVYVISSLLIPGPMRQFMDRHDLLYQFHIWLRWSNRSKIIFRRDRCAVSERSWDEFHSVLRALPVVPWSPGCCETDRCGRLLIQRYLFRKPLRAHKVEIRSLYRRTYRLVLH